MKILGRMPTVPEYYQEYINNSVNLLDNPKQCCPFHEENTPSFSYNLETGRWSCFGKCHAHGDVIDMHMRVFHMATRQEAEKSLQSLYEIPKATTVAELGGDVAFVNKDKIDNNIAYTVALSLANTPERWLELDYVMSKSPFERYELEALINKWRGFKD